MVNKKGPIGVFDSGFGGIDILRDMVVLLPEYNFLYLGDTARAPYGTRTQQTIRRFTQESIDFLLSKDCPLVIIACNTASSQALPLIKRQAPLIGMIQPTVKAAVRTKAQRIGVIATEATVRSNAFKNEIKKINPELKVFQKPAPLLVPIVEEGEENSKIARLAVKKYLASLLDKKIDLLILGCTHFGVLEKIIKKEAEGVRIIKQGPLLAKEIKGFLEKNSFLKKRIKKEGGIRFYTTDLTSKFVRLGSKFFGRKISAERIKL